MISDTTIKKLKRKHLLLHIPTLIIGSIIILLIFFFLLDDNDVFFLSLGVFVVTIPIIAFFSLKKGLKFIEKSLKSIQYSLDNEKLIIKNGNYEQYNILKDNIKCIDKYKNKVIINLKNRERICVNKNLENIDDLVGELGRLSTVNELNKNDNKNIKTTKVYLLIGIISFILYGIFHIVQDNILIFISGSLIVLFFIGTLIYIRTYKNIKKKDKIFLFFVFMSITYLIIVEIFEKIQ